MDGHYPKGVTTQTVLKITGIAMRGCNCNWKVNVTRSRFRTLNLVVVVVTFITTDPSRSHYITSVGGRLKGFGG